MNQRRDRTLICFPALASAKSKQEEITITSPLILSPSCEFRPFFFCLTFLSVSILPYLVGFFSAVSVFAVSRFSRTLSPAASRRSGRIPRGETRVSGATKAKREESGASNERRTGGGRDLGGMGAMPLAHEAD